jgi:hypothetical protein
MLPQAKTFFLEFWRCTGRFWLQMILASEPPTLLLLVSHSKENCKKATATSAMAAFTDKNVGFGRIRLIHSMQGGCKVVQSIRSGFVSILRSWHVCISFLSDGEGDKLRHFAKKEVCRVVSTKNAVTRGRSSSLRVDEGWMKVRMKKMNNV